MSKHSNLRKRIMNITYDKAKIEDFECIYPFNKQQIDDYEIIENIDYDRALIWVRKKSFKRISKKAICTSEQSLSYRMSGR